ncbi:MAG TPA: GNAT family N-acetyltransferase [Aggregatilineales bacterium]|nr:GNAT family N-acetyltransferase [Aggregatilineales bacterium]
MLPAICQNIRTFYEHTFWDIPTAITEYGEGYVMSYSGHAWLSGANQLWIDDLSVLDNALLTKAVQFFRTYFAEWSILVIPQLHPEMMTTLKDMGSLLRWKSPIMVLHGLPDVIPEVENPPRIRIQPAHGEYLRQMVSNIIGEVFHMDAGVRQNVVRPEHDYDEYIHHYIAFHEDHPAAAATLIYAGGIAGIWNVGTRTMFRRRGLAQALMLRLCQDAIAREHHTSALMASGQGKPIYLQMGYQVVAEAHYLGF